MDLEVGEWKLIGIYREWALCGDQTTMSKDQQIDRLTDFVNFWSGIKTKYVFLGDFNFDPFTDSDYQRSLENIKTCVNDVQIHTEAVYAQMSDFYEVSSLIIALLIPLGPQM